LEIQDIDESVEQIFKYLEEKGVFNNF